MTRVGHKDSTQRVGIDLTRGSKVSIKSFLLRKINIRIKKNTNKKINVGQEVRVNLKTLQDTAMIG